MNPDFDPSKAHHTPTGFRNTADTPRKSSAEFFRWQRERRELVIPPPRADLTPLEPDIDYIRANRTEFAVTWIGHATALVQLGGLNFLTDPHFSERAKSRRTVAIHWGTFPLTDEPLDQPLADLAAARARHRLAPGEFVTLRHGETLKLDPEHVARPEPLPR